MDYIKKLAAPNKAGTHRLGNQIVVIGGKYEKCYGFLDLSKGKNGKTVFYAHCLLVDENDEYHSVRLSKLNVKERNHDFVPSTVFQASLLQVPKLEKKFVALARDVALVYNMHADAKQAVVEATQYFQNLLVSQFEDVAGSGSKKWTVIDMSKVNQGTQQMQV